MSQKNVEIVRRAWEFEGEALANYDPDFVWNRVDELPVYGLDAAVRSDQDWKAGGEGLEETAEEFIDAGDTVVVRYDYRGRGPASGIEVEASFYELYTLRGGKIVRVDEFAERAEALEAAGLSE